MALAEAIEMQDRSPQPAERIRFTIKGLWIDLRVLQFGSVVVRIVAYSPGQTSPQIQKLDIPILGKILLEQELAVLADSGQLMSGAR